MPIENPNKRAAANKENKKDTVRPVEKSKKSLASASSGAGESTLQNNASASNAGNQVQNALTTVSIRNRFFFVFYRRLMLMFILSLISSILAIVLAVFFATRKVPPVYIPMSSENRIVETFPFDQPSINDQEKMNAEVIKFALSAAKKLYSYDYLNYEDQISEAEDYFTVSGWDRYLTEFTASNQIATVQDRRMIVKFIPLGAPVIFFQGLIPNGDGRYKWQVKFPMKINYISHAQGAGSSGVNSLSIEGELQMLITRISLIDSPKGIAIESINIKESRK